MENNQNSVLTVEQEFAIAEFLKGRFIPSGIGTKEAACSIAAINLALTGELTDDIPDCMSDVIGRWIICIQDAMPNDMRNSNEWRNLLPYAAGTGKNLEEVRKVLILNWMWETVLPSIQKIANKYNFGEAWQLMCENRTAEAAEAAEATIYASEADAYAADAAACAGRAASSVDASYAFDTAAAVAVAHVANAAASAAVAADDTIWLHFNPAKLLAELIAVQE